MVSAAIIFLQSSCILPQAILLYRGRDKVLPERYFSLGRYGVAINAISVAWVVFLDVVYCLPVFLPVTPQNMNYVSVVCTGLVGFVLGLWFISKKKSFTGPKIDMVALTERRMAALHGGIIVDGVGHDNESIETSQETAQVNSKRDL